jgi:hypothetical protein
MPVNSIGIEDNEYIIIKTHHLFIAYPGRIFKKLNEVPLAGLSL